MHKQSRYNYIIPQDRRFVYFNGISTHSFSASAEEHEYLKPLFNDPISFEMTYPAIFKQLTGWGFFVKEDVDEVDILRFRHKMAVIDSRDYHLVINPTLECNFSCWYCYQEHPKGYMSEKTKQTVMAHIKYMVEKKHITRLDLSWFGGEPLLYFDEVVYPISAYAKLLCGKHNIPYRAQIITNGSKIDLAMIKKMNEIKPISFQVTIDGDPERHNLIRNENGKPSFDTIMENIVNLCEYIEDVRITLRLNYDDETLQSCSIEKIFEDIPQKHRQSIVPNFQRVWQTAKKHHSSTDTEATFENQRRLYLSELCKRLGFATNSPSNAFAIGAHNKCYADRSYYAQINYDGKLYSCTARNCTEEHEIGTLLENGVAVYNSEKRIKKLARAPFENEMCLSCRYLPLCLGPCSQKVMETDKSQLTSICNLKHMEVSPETVILDYHNRKSGTICITTQVKNKKIKTMTPLTNDFEIMQSQTSPIISIVMPVYNAPTDYLQESIDSVLNQTFGDFEFLIIDDGSTETDGVDFIKTYQDPRIRLITNPHNFIDSLNRGIAESKGKYIARMDADDIMLPNRLQKQYDFMEKNTEIDVCSSWSEHFGNQKKTIRSPIIHNEIVASLLLHNLIVHPAIILRKSTVCKEGNTLYRHGYDCAEDYKLWTELAIKGLRFANIPEILVRNRISDSQQTAIKRKEMIQSSLKIRLEYADEIMDKMIAKEGRYAGLFNEMTKLCNEQVIPANAFINMVYNLLQVNRGML